MVWCQEGREVMLSELRKWEILQILFFSTCLNNIDGYQTKYLPYT